MATKREDIGKKKRPTKHPRPSRAWGQLLAGLGMATLLVTACSGQDSESNTREQTLLLDPDFSGDPTPPATSHTLFEADPVRPVAILSSSGMVAVANTADDSVEFFKQMGNRRKRRLEHCGHVKVGMRPVALAVTGQKRQHADLWVVNHLSDSISVVSIDVGDCQAEVTRTIHVGDEPRDVVVAKTSVGDERVFVTTAHRGQHHPQATARSGADLVTPPDQKQSKGMADVFVFNPTAPDAAPTVINLFTDTPRALAVGQGVIYAAGFHTGNGTTLIPSGRAAEEGLRSVSPLLARDEQGALVVEGQQLVVREAAIGVAKVSGGMRAVSGMGRCIPDPRPQFHNPFLQQVCVETDAANRILAAHFVAEGEVNPTCQCTSGDGTLQPTTAVIAQFFTTAEACGDDFEVFPDQASGCWLDAEPGGVLTPAEGAAHQSPPVAWNRQVKLSLPDEDVFAIGVDSLAVTRSFSGVGTVLFGMVVQPQTGDVFVLNTESKNLTRFEGVGEHSSTTVRGHLAESRITKLSQDGKVLPIHLNNHIDYSVCCDENVAEKAASLAFPTSAVFSPDGSRLFFSALGSDKVAVLDAASLGADFTNKGARASGKLRELYAGTDETNPSGPVAVDLSSDGKTLYVKTHFSNELLVLDADNGEELQRLGLPTPEPDSIRRGRHLLYNARLTSSHGDSACASCHIFGNMDSLAWDLGDPDAGTVKNPGPFALAPDFAFLGEIAQDPSFEGITPDFRSNKGPMTTQTLRGMANHGAQHWRGDRTRRFQESPGEQPNFGSLNEDNSFGEFDVAIFGLNGKSQLLAPEDFQAFTNFSLQLTLPPNPIRALDNTLTAEQAAGRALFFGCSGQTDEQFKARTCTGLSGNEVNVDQGGADCGCSANTFVRVLDLGLQILPFVQTVQELLANEEIATQFFAIASDPNGLSPEVLPMQAALVDQLRESVTALAAADLTLDEKNIIPLKGATTLAQATGSLLTTLGFFQQQGVPTGQLMIELLLSYVPDQAKEPPSPFASVEDFAQSLPNVIGVSNFSIRVQTDEAARGTAGFRNLLFDCAIGAPRSCDLRVTDTFHTCNGCHSLDPEGNSQFDVYRPGFFGTQGEYSFENESQIMKVPHLRNAYQKAGMFGATQTDFLLPESVLGARAGGFFAPDTAYLGPQVRGTGFLHDGSIDTTHRFFGATVFVARPSEPPIDPGNPGALDFFLPVADSVPTCVNTFRAADLSALPPLDPELTQALSFCSAASGLPDSCFIDETGDDCQAALASFAEFLQMPDFPQVFAGQIRPACFQLGSTLEGGSSDGACYPRGLVERAQLESFVMAFDTNLKPMVGQQVTVTRHDAGDDLLLAKMVAAAARNECHIAAFRRGKGYVMTSPKPQQPLSSLLSPTKGGQKTLAKLLQGRTPVTLTCYPPQPGQAEAWEAVN